MNAKNMNNIKKSERRIFRYTLADAWRDTISQVEVLEGIENKNVRCLYFDRPHRFGRTSNTNVDFFFTTITQEDIGIIKHAMQSHIDIFQYKEIELPVVLIHLNLCWMKISQIQLLLIILGRLEKMSILESSELIHIREALFYSYSIKFQRSCWSME